jgi:RNA polymerase sigma factor (sigma-70 family)
MKCPRLTTQQEADLVLAYRNAPTSRERARARDQLFASCWPFVLRQARRFRSGHDDIEELAQVGAVGLMRGLESYELGRGSRVLSWAAHWVFWEMRAWLDSRASVVALPHHLAFQRARQLHRSGLAKNPEELAELSGAGLPTCAAAWGVLEQGDASLDIRRHTPEGWIGEDEVLGLHADVEPTDEKISRQQDVRLVDGKVNSLPERERECVRGMMSGSVGAVIGRCLGVTRQRASQLEQQGLVRLARALGAPEPAPGAVRESLKRAA